MPLFEGPLEIPFAAEAAQGLGHSGRRLRKKLDELHKYDAQVASNLRRAVAAERSSLVAEAGEAFWGYVVQREIIGLQDADYIGREYQVPDEVWKSMRPRKQTL